MHPRLRSQEIKVLQGWGWCRWGNCSFCSMSGTCMSNHKYTCYCMVICLSPKVLRQKYCYSRGYCMPLKQFSGSLIFSDFWEFLSWISLNFTVEIINQSSKRKVNFYYEIPTYLEDYPWMQQRLKYMLYSHASRSWVLLLWTWTMEKHLSICTWTCTELFLLLSLWLIVGGPGKANSATEIPSALYCPSPHANIIFCLLGTGKKRRH